MTTRFFNELLKIDSTHYACGVLGRMDAVLRLTGGDYCNADIVDGLCYVARRIKNPDARRIAIECYTRRVR